MSSSRSDDVTNLSHFLLMLFFNAFLKLHFEHYEHSEHTEQDDLQDEEDLKNEDDLRNVSLSLFVRQHFCH